LAHLDLILGGEQLMLQTAIGNGYAFDALSLGKNSVAPAEIDIGRRQVQQAFIGACVVVVGNEGFDALFKLAGQIGVLEQNRLFIV
jgi:hypothetical protein